MTFENYYHVLAVSSLVELTPISRFFYCFYCLPHMGMMQRTNGLGLQAASGKDHCQVTMKFPSDTIPKWVISYIDLLYYISFDGNMRFNCRLESCWTLFLIG